MELGPAARAAHTGADPHGREAPLRSQSLAPVYRRANPSARGRGSPAHWHATPGLRERPRGPGFGFENEGPATSRVRARLRARLAPRHQRGVRGLVEDRATRGPSCALERLARCSARAGSAALLAARGRSWHHYTLAACESGGSRAGGAVSLRGRRLRALGRVRGSPTEAEWEVWRRARPLRATFVASGRLRPGGPRCSARLRLAARALSA